MKLQLGTRIGIGYGALIAVLLLTLVTSLLSFEAVRREAHVVRDVQIPTIRIANRMLVALDEMEESEFQYFLHTKTLSHWTKRFDDAQSGFETAFDQAQSLNPTSVERQNLDTIDRDFGTYLDVDARMREALTQGKPAAGQALNETVSESQADAIRDALNAYRHLNLTAIGGTEQRVEEGFSRTEAIAAASVILGALLGLILWWNAANDIVGPLTALQRATRAFAGGTYTPLDVPAARRTTELAALQEDFNAMAHVLSRTNDALQQANTSLESQVATRTAELADANAQLQASLAELRTLDKLKSDFMAVVSHELLTPINFISAYGTTLEDGLLGELNEEQQRAVQRMVEGSQRLTRMVRNILDFTEVESGRLSIRPEETDLAPIVADAVELIRPAATGKHQALQVFMPEQLPTVRVDPGRVSQILGELLDNAIKFTGEGGRIGVTVRVLAKDLEIEIADTGIGISPEAQTHLFEGFYQADLSSTRRFGGLGLGLALSNYLVTRMGGAITVRSRLGEGSIFTVRLPREDA
ncbi:MAG TPA: ATP-binding protein [Oscillatoriaceae cyanobacterium]